MKYTEEIRFVIERLEARGFEAYLVGGALRDALLGRKPGDFDVTTAALPSEMQEVFADVRTIETGLKHGTLTVLVNGKPIEVTTFRIDGEYLDARHPSGVVFTRSLEEDLKRRDFTVNAMAYSEKAGLVDLFHGREDLQTGLIRAVGDPAKRFTEDALRMLRAFRFASKLGFSIEEETFRAISACREGLCHISAERIASELSGILGGKNAVQALTLMEKSGVLALVLPEALLDGALERLSPEFETRLAFLLRNCENGELSARLHALKLSNASIQKVTALVALSRENEPCADAPQVRRLMAKSGENFAPLLEIFEAKGKSTEKIKDVAARIQERGDCLRISELALSGADLIALGYKGKAVGEVLSTLLEAVLDDPALNQKEKLKDFLQQYKI